MLVDYVDPERLPFWVMFIDWNMYAYRPSLFVFLLAGFVAWNVYVAVRYGYAVG